MFHRSPGLAILQGLILLAVPSCWPGATRADEKADLLAAFNAGLALQQKADYPGAAKAFERALELAPRVFGPEHKDTATILNNLALMYGNMGKYAQAEPLYQRSLKIMESRLGPDHPDVAASLDNLAALYEKMGQHPKAEPLFQRSLNIRKAELLETFNAGLAMQQKAWYSGAATSFEIALQLAPRVYGPEDPNTATIVNNLADMYCAMGQYAQAEPLYQRSLKIRESKLGANHPDVAQSLNNLAQLYQAMGQYAHAESLFKRSLKIFESKLGPDHPHVATSLNNLAGLYQEMGGYAQAEPLYQRSLKILESKLGPDHPDVAVCLNNLAILYAYMGQYAQAEPLCQRSIKISASTLGPDHPDVATSLNVLAAISEMMGQYAQAEPLYQRSLKIRETMLGPDHPAVATSLSNLAELYEKMGRYAQAEPLHQRSLKIRETTLGPDHPAVAMSLSNLAELYEKMGRYAQAEPLSKRSLKIFESKLGPDHPHVATSLNNLAGLYREMGGYAQAEPLFKRSLKIFESKLGPDHPHVATSLSNLACLHSAAERWSEATAETEKARRIVRRHVARTLPILNEKEQLTFLQAQDETDLHSALSLGLAQRSDARIALRSAGWVLNGKAVAQEVLAQRAILAAEGTDPSLAELVKQLLTVRGKLASLSLAVPKQGQEASHGEQLNALNQQEQELSRQLGQATGRNTSGDPWVAPEAVRKALAKDALLIEIARFHIDTFKAKGKEDQWLPPHYAAWLIPAEGQGEISIVDLGEAKRVDAAVQQARTALEKAEKTIHDAGEAGAEKQVREAMQSLARMVWRPLEAHFGDARELVLSPDAALWLVPWAALPLADGKYVVEKYQIRYVISGRDLVSSGTTQQSKSTDPIVFANPDYDLGPADAVDRTRAVLRSMAPVERVAGSRGAGSFISLGRAERLPGTAKEAAAIRPGVTRYAGSEPVIYEDQYALEGVFKSLHGPKVLVLGTHGFFLPDQAVEHKDDRGARLAEEGSKGRAVLTTEGKPMENPLLRCGLLLAGCNQRVEEASADVDDGILTGLEIVGTDLRGTDLVVLCACETGLGQVRNGEGVAGLRQAFQLAGAKAVVATLWQIPDEETVALIKRFFGNLSAGQSKAEALRSAQLVQITARRQAHSAAHPYYWAAFTLTGQ
jgi:tetratricopeptide (TPR) repeat protein